MSRKVRWVQVTNHFQLSVERSRHTEVTIAWSVCQYVCPLWLSCTLPKSLDRIRCRLAGTLIWCILLQLLCVMWLLESWTVWAGFCKLTAWSAASRSSAQIISTQWPWTGLFADMSLWVRVPTHPWKSLNFFLNIQGLENTLNRVGAWKSLNLSFWNFLSL